MEPFNFCLCSINGCGIDLDYCDIELFALEMNRDHSFVFETAAKIAFWTLLLTMMVTPISSKGFLPTVVNIMVI